MEIDLNRLDLLHADQSEPGTLAVFEAGKSRQSKVIVGDRAGLVQCFAVKRTDIVNIYKSLPMGQKVTSLTVGYGDGQQDKAFMASDQTIRGMNKKGKEFFRFATNLTERITKVIVQDKRMWLAGEYNFNQYDDCKDRHFYMSPDRINDMQLMDMSGNGQPQHVALGCRDRCIRVLHGNEVYYEVATDGGVNAMETSEVRDHALKSHHKGESELLYGTATGQFGQVLMDPDSIRRGWVVSSERQGDGVTAMRCNTDFTNDGLPDILIGRSNGQLEMWAMDEAFEPHKVMTRDLNESIIALDSGFICTPDTQDAVLQTFSGKVVAFTNSPSVFNAPVPAGSKQPSKEAQIRTIKTEIAELKDRLAEEKERDQQLSTSAPVVSGSVLEIRHSFVLDESNSGKYILTVEAPVPLFGLAVQSEVAVHLLEAKGSAIVSRSPPDIPNGSMCLATYRCQESTNRVEVHMEVVEGQHGAVQAFAIPAAPPKTCTVVSCHLKPLCLHCRVESQASAATPLNELKVTGSFEIADIHSWIAFALPEVSARAPIEAEAVIHFKSTLLGTYLTCTYRAGQATFLSDSISALAILREAISKEANSSKMRVSITYQFNQGSISHMLGLLWPRLHEQRELAKKVQVMEALQELKMQDGDVSYMSQQHQADLKQADKLRAELASQPRRLDYLIGVVKDLFIDWNKFNGSGQSAFKRMPQLEELIQDPNTAKADVVKFILSN